MISAEDEMGRIIPRRSKSGTTGYHAQLLIKRKGTIISLESRALDVDNIDFLDHVKAAAFADHAMAANLTRSRRWTSGAPRRPAIACPLATPETRRRPSIRR